jgi:hypothetical protein
LAARKKSEEPRVRVAPLGELRAYTISEQELEQLERGAPVADLLTIGLSLLSAALALLITLLSTSLPDRTFVLFFCAFLIVGLGGVICAYLGWRLRTSTRELAREIRARMPVVPSIQEIGLVPPLPPASPEGPTGGTMPPERAAPSDGR